MKKQLNILIDESYKLLIEKLASKDDLSVSDFICQAVENYIPFYIRGVKRKKDLINNILSSNDLFEINWTKDIEKNENNN